MHFTPDTGTRRSKRPRFGYEATVEVYTRTGPDSRPAAVLKATDWSWSRDGAYSDATHRAKCQLAALQVPLEVIQNAYFETQIDAWWALDPKHVRNPEGRPVPAYLADQADRATLIRQQRLVPDDMADSTKLYLRPALAGDQQPDAPGAKAQANGLKGEASEAAVSHVATDLVVRPDALPVGMIDPLPQSVQQATQRADDDHTVGHLQGHSETQHQQADADHQQRLVPAVNDQGAHQFAHHGQPCKVDWLKDPDAMHKVQAAIDGSGGQVILPGGTLTLLSTTQAVPA